MELQPQIYGEIKVAHFWLLLQFFIGAFTITLTSAVNSGVNDYINRQLSIFGKENKSVQIIKKAEISGLSGGLREYKEGESEVSQGSYSAPALTGQDIEKAQKKLKVLKM